MINCGENPAAGVKAVPEPKVHVNALVKRMIAFYFLLKGENLCHSSACKTGEEKVK